MINSIELNHIGTNKDYIKFNNQSNSISFTHILEILISLYIIFKMYINVFLTSIQNQNL